MQKFLFPFFKEQHKFLIEKSWFRLLIVIYITAVIIFVPYTWYRLVASQYEDCETRAVQIYGSEEEAILAGAFVNCATLDFAFGWDGISFLFIFIPTVIFHYLFQLIFFKVVINFIILGGKEKFKV